MTPSQAYKAALSLAARDVEGFGLDPALTDSITKSILAIPAPDFPPAPVSNAIYKAALEAAARALEQAQDCIMGAQPEDMSYDEARQDTINKIRAALRLLGPLSIPNFPPDPHLTALAQTIRAEIERLRDSQSNNWEHKLTREDHFITALEWVLSKMEDKP